MSELGALLKEARTAKGYSLEDLQEMTKIQKRYLAGIEEGNYSMMPGPFYVRAFIKQYADAVGLNSDELLESYKQEVPTSSKEEVYQTMNSVPSRRRPISRSSGRFTEIFPMLMVALFIVAALVIFWFLYQNMAQKDDVGEESDKVENTTFDKSEDEPEKPVEEEPKEEEPVEEEPVEEPTPTQTIEVGAVEGETTNYTLSGTDTFSLKIVARGNSWVEVRNQAGVKPLSRNVAAGETVTLDLSDVQTARIRVGAAPQVDIFINDEKVEYGTPTSDRVTQNMMIQFSKQ